MDDSRKEWFDMIKAIRKSKIDELKQNIIDADNNGYIDMRGEGYSNVDKYVNDILGNHDAEVFWLEEIDSDGFADEVSYAEVFKLYQWLLNEYNYDDLEGNDDKFNLIMVQFKRFRAIEVAKDKDLAVALGY